jgi:hypothetical protein
MIPFSLSQKPPPPEIPINGVIGMLKQIGTFFM